MRKTPESVRVKWPVGPHYSRWARGKGPRAWANYKIKSADWYIETLRATARKAGGLDRYVGVEMAIDGAVLSLCAAVDAAGCALFTALVRKSGAIEAPTIEIGHWESSFGIARLMGVSLPSEAAVTKSLLGSAAEGPEGWYAQLRQLRDQITQHNALVRRFDFGNKPGRFIEVPGLGPRKPVNFLRSVRNDVAELVDALLSDCDALPKLLPAQSDADDYQDDKSRSLPSLLERAHVLDGPASGH